MFRRFTTAIALAVVSACAPASAAPVTVQLRVEGSASTLFEGPIATDGKPIDKGGGPHPCDGTTNPTTPPTPPGPTMTAALDDASFAAGFPWEATWFDFGDFFITKIGTDAGTASSFWGTVLNYEPTSLGGCWQQVRQGDDLLFGFGDVYSQPLLKLSGPQAASVGQWVTYAVTDAKTGSPVRGAVVAGRRTSAAGEARILFDSPGVKRLKAEAPNAIRSSTLTVCVAPGAGGDCGLPAQLGSQQNAAAVDRVAPSARIKGPRNGKRYARGPRLLRGTATDGQSGVRTVQLSLRKQSGRRCSQWSGRSERFVGKSCRRKAFFFDAGAGPNWSYLLPGPLPRGRYVLDVRAVDRAGNSQSRFVRGRTRVVFRVVR